MMVSKARKIYLALPAMDESENLPVLLEAIKKQCFQDFELFVCVNQPDNWWDKPEKTGVCRNNQESIRFLQGQGYEPKLRLIDRSSKGQGWKGKHFGVGWARKTLMDAINAEANKNDLIMSIDADTYYPENYLQSIVERFEGNPGKIALANPYFHPLCGDREIDRAVLRYEIYMRNYAINMLRIKNPYSFTALGSAIAVPVWAYRKVGGITPHKSGEDFYFLQKLRKSGELIIWNSETAFPSARKSDRVFFGTGPAIIKGLTGDWSSYPTYHHSLFQKVKDTFDSFEALFDNDMSMPMSAFLSDIFKDENIWQPLRDNAKSAKQFAAACFRKIDALRILQFLKSQQNANILPDGLCLIENLGLFDFDDKSEILTDMQNFPFESASIASLDKIRNTLVAIESNLQKAEMISNN
jgi:hypothetical protein